MPMNNTATVPEPVIWITGFSCSGKTTVAHLLRDRFVANGQRPVVLDGDAMRAVLGREYTYSNEARLELAWIYARLCRQISSQSVPVICATISMFHEVRAWSRANTPAYHEIYLRVPVGQRTARDSKGLYAAAAANKLASPIVGFDGNAEEPISPDLTIENWGTISADQTVDAIWQLLHHTRG